MHYATKALTRPLRQPKPETRATLALPLPLHAQACEEIQTVLNPSEYGILQPLLISFYEVPEEAVRMA
jgi:hypothetical protein